MIKKKKSILLLVISGLLCLFMLYNFFWYIWAQMKYGSYIQNMEPYIKYNRYVLEEEDGYLYNVKYPDYLQMKGNMCVATPDGKGALLIWPKLTGGYEYGLQIEDAGTTYGISLNERMEAIDPNYSDIISCSKGMIKRLKVKAHKMWNIRW